LALKATWVNISPFQVPQRHGIHQTDTTLWISAEVNDWFGKFTFGVFLLIRWLTSAFIGAYPANKRCEEFHNTYGSGSAFSNEIKDEIFKSRRKNNEP